MKRILLEILKAFLGAMVAISALLGMVWLNGTSTVQAQESKAQQKKEAISFNGPPTVKPSDELMQVMKVMDEEDFKAMEEVIYWESVRADCDMEVSAAVIETILNRAINRGQKVSDVCRAEGQFVTGSYIHTEYVDEKISDAVEYVMHEGRTLLPKDYEFFATAKQSLGQDHVWIGKMIEDVPVPGKGMWFCREKGESNDAVANG